MPRLRSKLDLLRLLTMLWLPFCCCQWQGMAAVWATDEATIAVSCGSACCQREPASETPSPESPAGEDRCSFECCIRGELPTPAWEPPIDRIGTDLAAAATTLEAAAPSDRILAKAHPPPLGASPPDARPVAAHIRIQV